MSGLFGAFVAPFRKNAVVGSELGFGPWGGGTGAGIHVNAFSGLQYGPLLSCVNIISEDLAKLPIGMFRRLTNGGKEPVYNHFLAKLLDRPNPWQNRMEFVEQMQAFLLLRSNAFAVIIRNDRGQPEQLIPVHPDRVALYEAPGPGGEYFFFITRNGLWETSVLSSVPIIVAAEDCFHLRWLSQTRTLLGTSRVDLIRESVGIGLAQEQTLARLLGQGSRPGGVLTTPQKLNKETFDRIQAAWQESHGGWRNGGKTAILEGGLVWSQTEMTLQNAEFNQGREYQLRETARALRVPLHKLGLMGETAPANMIQYETLYWNDCISVWADRWKLKLEELGDLDGRDLFVSFDYERILAADIKTQMDVCRAGVGMSILRQTKRVGTSDFRKIRREITSWLPPAWCAWERHPEGRGSRAAMLREGPR